MFIEIATGVIILGTYVYHRWVEDHPAPPILPVSTPTIDEGSAVPLIYGKCRVRSAVLAWAGSQRQYFPQSHVAYFLDMFYVLGIPFNGGGATLGAVFAGDLIMSGNGTKWPFQPDELTGATVPMFGAFSNSGNKRHIWFQMPFTNVYDNLIDPALNFGFIEFFGGSPTQQIGGLDNGADPLSDTEGVLRASPMNPLYTFISDDFTREEKMPDLPPEIDASLIPSYRNMVTCCMYHWLNGDTTQLPNYSFEVESLSFGGPSDLGAPILNSLDADPAAVIYDLLTSPWGKLGIPIDRIDVPSFQAASATLYAENHGFSMAIDQLTDADQIINDILRQIDGVMYEEPATGKMVLKLVRNNYSIGSLQSINPNNAKPGSGAWYSVQGWSESINQVRVKFTDRQNFYNEGLVVGQNAANVLSQGGRLRSLDISFLGCCTRDLAQRLASRELAAVSRPMVKISVVADRSLYQARPGSVYTFSWPPLGIDSMVMRVARADLGQLHKGEIGLDMVRDIFDVSNGAYPYVIA